jgi:MFS family permease
MVVMGLVGTLLGGFVATAWQKRHPAGYARMLGLSVLVSAPLAFIALLAANRYVSMTLIGASMFFMFLCTGPVNTLIIETVPLNLRASAMAISIFMIHLFGDMWSPEIVGRLADHWNHDVHLAMMILPVALLVAAVLWLALAIKMARPVRATGVPKDRELDVPASTP